LNQLGRDNIIFFGANFTFALSYGLWYNLRGLHLADLGASPEMVGTALAVSGIASGIVPLPSGYLVDRVGPRRVLLAAWLIGALGAVVMALANTWQVVTLGLVVFSLSTAGNPAAVAFVMSNVRERAEDENTQRQLSLVFRSWPAAMIFAPFLGGLLADWLGIRADLWAGAAGFALAIIIFVRTREVEIIPQNPGDGGVLVLFRNRAFLLVAGYYTLLTLVLYIGYTLAPNYLEDTLGFSSGTIGTLFSLFSLGTFLANILIARVKPKLAGVVLLVGVWLALLGLWGLRAVVPIGFIFIPFGGLIAVWVLKTADIERAVPAQNLGLAFGVVESLTFIAGALTSWLAGILYEMNAAHDLPLVAGLLSIPVMLVLWFLLPGLVRRVSS
jgi:DHA1 family bicyclomycin/chloramphenicol resistance-like MFS transporter